MVRHDQSSQPPAFEDRVREALHHEADTVEPSGHALSTIQARTAGGTGGRARARWFAGGAAVLATAAAVTAIAVVGSADLGLGPEPGPSPAAPAAPTEPLQIFYLDSTPEKRGEPGSETVAAPGLYAETHRVEVPRGPVEAAVRELAAGTPEDADYTNPWAGTTVNSVRVDPDRVLVDVDAVPTGPARDAAEQQIAHTVQSAAGRRIGVAVTAQGTLVIDTVAAAPVGTYANIWVTAPEQGATVGSPVRFSGMAATFEGNVAFEVRRGGQVVARGATITRGGMGVWSGWSVTRRLPPGDYTLVAFDEDPALGGRRDIDTKAFSVR